MMPIENRCKLAWAEKYYDVKYMPQEKVLKSPKSDVFFVCLA